MEVVGSNAIAQGLSISVFGSKSRISMVFRQFTLYCDGLKPWNGCKPRCQCHIYVTLISCNPHPDLPPTKVLYLHDFKRFCPISPLFCEFLSVSCNLCSSNQIPHDSNTLRKFLFICPSVCLSVSLLVRLSICWPIYCFFIVDQKWQRGARLAITLSSQIRILS